MSDLDVSCYVTTADPAVVGGRVFLDGEPDATHPGLSSVGRYSLVSVGAGPMTWRRSEVTSPYAHGSVLVAAVKDNPVIPLVVRAYGESANDLNVNTALLLRCFEQFTYELHLAVDGEFWVWRCQPADYAPVQADGFDKFGLMSHQQAYSFHIPRDPIPISGSM